MGRTLRGISRTIRRRTGDAKVEVLKLTEQTGKLLERSVREARKLAATARRSARGRGAQAKLRLAARLEELADRGAKVAAQIRKRVAGEPITDRLVSLADPDTRPIRKGKLGKPNEFGYVTQLAEVTQNTKRGARGFILPPASAPGNPTEDTLLPSTVAELDRLGLSPREVALDGGFNVGPTQRRARVPGARTSLHLRPPTARIQTHATAHAALPDRRRGPHQSPQTRLRTAPQPAQRRPRPADLERLGDPRLQPRHLHPPHLTQRARVIARPARSPDPGETAAQDETATANTRALTAKRPRRLSGASS
jgi:hypothetical protein